MLICTPRTSPPVRPPRRGHETCTLHQVQGGSGDNFRALGIGLLYGARGRRFLMSEVPLHTRFLISEVPLYTRFPMSEVPLYTR